MIEWERASDDPLLEEWRERLQKALDTVDNDDVIREAEDMVSLLENLDPPPCTEEILRWAMEHDGIVEVDALGRLVKFGREDHAVRPISRWWLMTDDDVVEEFLRAEKATAPGG